MRVEDVTTTLVYTYNGDGHRVAKALDGVTTTYVVAVLGLSQVLVETTGGDSIVYLYGHDLLGEEGDAWQWHLGDGLGSVRQLADSSGNVALAQGYTPFGVPMWDEGSGATGYGFTGERWEAYSELLFLRARYYQPGTGRFLTRDPVIGNHPYSYVGGNPIRFTDPTGKDYLPQWDAYTCDHRGGPDPRDPYAYRLTWSDAARQLYYSAGVIVSRDPSSAVIAGYDYRGVVCVQSPENLPAWQPGIRWGGGIPPWKWTEGKAKTLLPLFEALLGKCECTPIPNPVTLFVLEQFYEEGNADAFGYWASQQKAFDLRGTPFSGDLVGDWYYEQGSEYRVYGPDALMTRETIGHPSVSLAREEFCEWGCPSYYRLPYHDSLRNPALRNRTIERNIFDAGNCIVGFDGACIDFFLGSRDVEVHNNGDGTATFVISNKTGRCSGTRSIFGACEMSDETRRETRWDPDEPNWSPFGLDVTHLGLAPGPSGWGGDLWQHYVWVEVMPCCK